MITLISFYFSKIAKTVFPVQSKDVQLTQGGFNLA